MMKSIRFSIVSALILGAVAPSFAATSQLYQQSCLKTATVQVVNTTYQAQNVSLLPSNYLAPIAFPLSGVQAGQNIATYDMGLQLPLKFNASFTDQKGRVHHCSAPVRCSYGSPKIYIVDNNYVCGIYAR